MGEGASLEWPSKMDDPEIQNRRFKRLGADWEWTDRPSTFNRLGRPFRPSTFKFSGRKVLQWTVSKEKNERSKKTGRSYEHRHSERKGQTYWLKTGRSFWMKVSSALEHLLAFFLELMKQHFQKILTWIAMLTGDHLQIINKRFDLINCFSLIWTSPI